MKNKLKMFESNNLPHSDIWVVHQAPRVDPLTQGIYHQSDFPNRQDT